MTFRHDEVRDWHDNIRLDYGYAMTIASAQGLTVDRAFLLVDDRPARETIYPAATRHREALDIYVNRSPLAFDIAGHRPEDEAERPVLDSDVRAYLAERWSRSQPKEAALDYVSEGAWRGARDEAPRRGRATGEGRRETADAHAAANDNAFVRIADEIRHAVNGWRHGAAVDAFAAERGEVLAAWDGLRARARDEGDAVALSPAFRQTLDRHGALMKQAASFRARPQVFERLLADRAGIGQGEIEELRGVHARAGSYHRSAAARAAHARRTEAERSRETTRAEEPVEATARPPERSQEAQEASRAERPVETAVRPPARSREADPTEKPVETAARPPKRPAETRRAGEESPPPVSPERYRLLRREWSIHCHRAERRGVHHWDLDGAAALIERTAEFAGNQRVPAAPRRRLQAMVDGYHAHVRSRTHVQNWLKASDEHWERFHSLWRRARALDTWIDTLPAHADWLERNERLRREGRAILDDPGTYGVHLHRGEDFVEPVDDSVSRMDRLSPQHQAQSRSRDRGRSWSM